ncbi:MAG: hypothetical protein LBU37_06335 [Tannerellaceae bacterium]|jgi:hypothetical protein|nr:hypothetical protein [Tannerellaceae bacterium]
MDNKKTYEEITGYIRDVSPLLDNPEELTQRIMTRVERTDRNKKKRKIMHITGLVSGVAACLLLCLLAYESVQPSAHHAAGMEISMKLPDRQWVKSDTDIVGLIGENLKRKDIKKRIYSRYSRKLSNLSK